MEQPPMKKQRLADAMHDRLETALRAGQGIAVVLDDSDPRLTQPVYVPAPNGMLYDDAGTPNPNQTGPLDKLYMETEFERMNLVALNPDYQFATRCAGRRNEGVLELVQETGLVEKQTFERELKEEIAAERRKRQLTVEQRTNLKIEMVANVNAKKADLAQLHIVQHSFEATTHRWSWLATLTGFPTLFYDTKTTVRDADDSEWASSFQSPLPYWLLSRIIFKQYRIAVNPDTGAGYEQFFRETLSDIEYWRWNDPIAKRIFNAFNNISIINMRIVAAGGRAAVIFLRTAYLVLRDFVLCSVLPYRPDERFLNEAWFVQHKSDQNLRKNVPLYDTVDAIATQMANLMNSRRERSSYAGDGEDQSQVYPQVADIDDADIKSLSVCRASASLRSYLHYDEATDAGFMSILDILETRLSTRGMQRFIVWLTKDYTLASVFYLEIAHVLMDPAFILHTDAIPFNIDSVHDPKGMARILDRLHRFDTSKDDAKKVPDGYQITLNWIKPVDAVTVTIKKNADKLAEQLLRLPEDKRTEARRILVRYVLMLPFFVDGERLVTILHKLAISADNGPKIEPQALETITTMADMKAPSLANRVIYMLSQLDVIDDGSEIIPVTPSASSGLLSKAAVGLVRFISPTIGDVIDYIYADAERPILAGPVSSATLNGWTLGSQFSRELLRSTYSNVTAFAQIQAIGSKGQGKQHFTFINATNNTPLVVPTNQNLFNKYGFQAIYLVMYYTKTVMNYSKKQENFAEFRPHDSNDFIDWLVVNQEQAANVDAAITTNAPGNYSDAANIQLAANADSSLHATFHALVMEKLTGDKQPRLSVPGILDAQANVSYLRFLEVMCLFVGRFYPDNERRLNAEIVALDQKIKDALVAIADMSKPNYGAALSDIKALTLNLNIPSRAWNRLPHILGRMVFTAQFTSAIQKATILIRRSKIKDLWQTPTEILTGNTLQGNGRGAFIDDASSDADAKEILIDAFCDLVVSLMNQIAQRFNRQYNTAAQNAMAEMDMFKACQGFGLVAAFPLAHTTGAWAVVYKSST